MNETEQQVVLLKTIDLTIGYSKKPGSALSGIFNLSAKKAELIALVGKNGIGKSTLLKTLVKLQPPVSGKIFLKGKLLQDFSPKNLATFLSFVYTEPVHVNNLRVFDLVAMGRYPFTNWFGTNRDTDLKMINNAIRLTGIENLKEKNILHISDGERQRAMIARTLAQNTQIIILDEPTAFLDLTNKYEIVHILKKLTRDHNKTIIFSTHELNIAIEEADKIWLMTSDGIHQGAPEDLIFEKKFTSMFDKKDSAYISEKGELKVRKEFFKKIGLSGQGKEFQLTKKALERIGIECVPVIDKEEQVSIQSLEHFIEWNYISESTHIKFWNIYSLISHIRDKMKI